MTDPQFFGLLGLLSVAALAVGFVLGFCVGEENND